MRLSLALCAALTLAAAPGAQVTASPVHGPPSAIALSHDAKTLFVGLDVVQGHGGGLAAYTRDGPALHEVARIDVPGGATGLALTPDDATLIVATRVGLAAVSTSALLAGMVHALAVVRDSDAPGTNQVVLSADGRYAFATNSQSATLGVAQVTSGTSPSLRYVGHVPLDRRPDGLAISPDGATIYVASEVAAGDPAGVSAERDRRLGRPLCAINFGSNGVLSAVDVRTAIAAPLHAVVARVAAGCAPARVAVSPDGRTVWVSVRGENRVLAIDAARMHADPERALMAVVTVGPAPIGLAFSNDGTSLLVANSAGASDSDEARGASLSLVDVRAALEGKAAIRSTLAAGKLAREVLASPDGSFLITEYGSKAVAQVLPPKGNEGT